MVALRLRSMVEEHTAEGIVRAIAFAIEQPADVDVNEIVVRPIEQSG